MLAPSPKKIAAEIAELKQIRPLVRPMSIFGDDHRQNIGIIIEVLEGGLTEDHIYDRSRGEEEEDDSAGGEWNFSNREAALHARRWLDGESQDGTPSDGYKELLEKPEKHK